MNYQELTVHYPISEEFCLKANESDFFRFLELRKALEAKEMELQPMRDELKKLSKKYAQTPQQQ